ncbi:VWA domain-containing protein [Ponticaulis sp.]|uniref:VWA domain-containing protein n=1 Tax=Ponticaulis sp. TaxID=2020902 RepID=UPI0025E0F3B1|nr:VWA domain-containing protein [Ponticaulis sp.]|tara:strand:- start:116084 stop:117274 length:1191 start_codon:yes stop_codon:yes gene_type:complete
MIFALCVAVIVTVIGISIDLSRTVGAESEAQYAADATVLAAVGQTDLTPAELTEWAQTYFLQNFPQARDLSADHLRIRRISDETVTIDFSGALNTTFAAILGKDKLNFSVTSTASYPREYLDIYFVLDRSASMLIADGEDAIDDLMDATKPWIQAYGSWYRDAEPEGCAFACHLPGGGGEPWYPSDLTLIDLADDLDIPLRNQRVMDAALEVAEVVSENREGVRFASIDFGSDTNLVQRLTSNILRMRSVLDVSYGTEVDRWDTDYPELFDFLERQITTAGEGTQANPDKMVILITDGLYTHGSSHSYDAFDADFCTTLKNRGVRMAVINTVYDRLDHSLRYVWNRVGENSALAATAMESCASEGYYFEANDPDEIDRVFEELAQQILDDPLRLTN